MNHTQSVLAFRLVCIRFLFTKRRKIASWNHYLHPKILFASKDGNSQQGKHAGEECLSANKNRITFVSDLVVSVHSLVHRRRKPYTKNVLCSR